MSSDRKPAPAQALHRAIPPLGIPLIPGHPQVAGGSLFPHRPPQAAEEQLPDHGLHYRLQGNLCSINWSTSSLSSLTDLAVYWAVPLTYPHSSLQLQSLLCSKFLNLLPTVTATIDDGSGLELAVISSWQVLTETTPVAPPLPKSRHINPLHPLRPGLYHSNPHTWHLQKLSIIPDIILMKHHNTVFYITFYSPKISFIT